MNAKRMFGPAALTAVLAVSGFAGAVAAQELEPVEDSATGQATTGTIVLLEEDGRTNYYLDPGDGNLILLSYGPSWFWGPLSPFDGLEDVAVTIGGQLRDGQPNEHASDMAKEKAAKDPALKVRSINGEKRKGKPAWAGGPKVVGEVHPGHAGWSKGQAAKAEKPAKPPKPAKPEKPAKP